MTEGASGADFSDAELWAARALQAVLLGLAAYGAFVGKYTVAVSGLLSFAVTLVPAYLRRDRGFPLSPQMTLWITVAVVLHSAGYLGPYRTVGWYDQLTHGFSATVVAAGGYALVRAFVDHSDHLDLPRRFVAVYVVIFVLAFGVFWEVLEHAAELAASTLGMRSALVQYGLDDIVLDITFNTVGAVVVAAWAHLRGGELRPLWSAISRRWLGD